MANENLTSAKNAKNDEFYTQFADIEKEMNAYLDRDPDVFRDKVVLLPCDDPEWSNFTRYFAQNFERLGMRKLVSTSYAPSAVLRGEAQDGDEAAIHGKVYTLTRDITGDDRTDFRDLEWAYLDGDGDFRSPEVSALRDEADIVITNPPFSLFREFLAWVSDKRFVLIGNMNAITYKESFRLIQTDRMWLGATSNGSDMVFAVPAGSEVADADREKAARLGYVGNFTRLGNSCWFTNLDHGRRHEPLALMTMADNLRFSRHKEIRGRSAYEHYDNYDAIEVPFTDAIPSDYTGLMGVPISFLDKYAPEQFEIVGTLESSDPDNTARTRWYSAQDQKDAFFRRFGTQGTIPLNMSGVINDVKVFKRILIRHRRPAA